MKNRVLNIIFCVLLFLGFLAFCSAYWYKDLYGNVGFDSILFTLLSELNGVQTGLLWDYLLKGLLPCIVLWAAFSAVLFLPIKSADKKAKPLVPLKPFFNRLIAGVLSLALTVSGAFLVHLPSWAVAKFYRTTLFEEEFVEPSEVEITFPKNKQNLIYIFLESMETTYFSKELGGGMDYNLMPNLYLMAEDNLNFSQNQSVGGGHHITGATWTIAAMVAQTSGMPLKLPVGVDDNAYGEYAKFLPGATSITDILKENGYYQTLMVGSDATFGGRHKYYTQHGVDHVYDIYTAYEDGIVPDGYWNWWGMEDKYLFEYAKKELSEISKKDQPFSFTLLTVDTHFVDGCVCDKCPDSYTEQYENVISCSDRQVFEFVEWIKTQPFYENTTVIVTGDHLTMDDGYIRRSAGENFDRRVYNCFLNTAVDTKFNKNRDFTTFDMFPTTLAAIGCEIKGERLGLGTNLFSSEKTLTEKYGYDYISGELNEMSDYYNNKILNAY